MSNTNFRTAADAMGGNRDGNVGVIDPTLENTGWVAQHEPRFGAICERVEQQGEGLRVLDVGGEPWHLTNRLRGLDAVETLTVINRGTDDDRDRTDFVRLPNGTATVRYCNIEAHEWPVEDDAVDVVVMGAVLEHLFHPAHAVSEARRIAHPRGRLVLSTPNAMSLKARASMVAGLDTPHDGLVPPGAGSIYSRHQHEYSRAELADLLTCCGWVPEDVTGLQLHREGAVGRIYERVAGARDTLGDQWVLSAHPGTEWGGVPDVYRQGLVDRERQGGDGA